MYLMPTSTTHSVITDTYVQCLVQATHPILTTTLYVGTVIIPILLMENWKQRG